MMPNSVKISPRQLLILTILFTIGTAILIIPSVMAASAKQDAWIASFVGVGIGLLLIWLYNTITILYPQMTLIEIMETLLGKWLGKSVALLFVITFFLSGPAAVLYDSGSFLTTQMIPETPVQAVNILFALIVLMGVRLGIETLARSAELLFPLFILLYTAFVVLVVSNVKLENAQPMLERGWGPIWPAVLSFISIAFLSHVVLLMIFPFVDHPDQARKAFLIGSLIGGLTLVLLVTLAILVFGPGLTARNIYPSYLLAKKINIGNFLQRIEAVMTALWFISLFFRLVLYIYSIMIAITQIFNLKDYRPLISPFGMILVVMSVIIYPNVPYQQSWDAKIWTPYVLSIGLLLPVLLLCIHGIRKMWSKGKTGSKG
ncbi:endospore germination permease [Paenibacillus sp. BJ-4]|uniref:GerAB/ArcD/ProY family transporter n=1 Tax=Paenibacillus sp. BJ-4 TaxID=2878097 RepID=UPI00298F77C4|nr:endospore germination permease [Paenibacillus sp. BJ-4]